MSGFGIDSLLVSQSSTGEDARTVYPRATMKRGEWLPLNGSWECGVEFWTRTNGNFTGKINVPFPNGAVASGRPPRVFTELQRLWYRRQFTVPNEWLGKRLLLHFEAVDWEAKVWVNGHEMGTHRGGFDRFSFDVTDALKSNGEQELVVSVWDPTEAGYQPRGKQMQHVQEPFFHGVSGIWQTVWLEPVPERSIESLSLVPDIDSGGLRIRIAQRENGKPAFEIPMNSVGIRGSAEQSSGASKHGSQNVPSATAAFQTTSNRIIVEAVAYDGEQEVARTQGIPGQEFFLSIPNAKLWSPDFAFLYGLKVFLYRDGTKEDEVSSYFGMRKISVGKDAKGIPKLLLNNKQLFQFGPLDQGYWPEGVYAAPSDEALRHDIVVMKELGFNMCRKHVKVEPERWYYWCDRLGLVVWQDMPNGDRDASSKGKEIQRTLESSRQFEQELKQMIVQRGDHPCIVMWVPFNQGWGQYDTARITGLVKQWDPSRLIISASGWHDMGCGDVRSLHVYSAKFKAVQDGKRPCVIGECGALGLVVPDHLWGRVGRWNVNYCRNTDDLLKNYQILLSKLSALKEEEGLSAAVITQLTDVETELDGFMTYDRKIIKMPVKTLRAMNQGLINGSFGR